MKLNKENIMKKSIIIIATMLLFACTKENCYLYDNAGNSYEFRGDIRAAWSEYQAGGTTVINGITYSKLSNPLTRLCN